MLSLLPLLFVPGGVVLGHYFTSDDGEFSFRELAILTALGPPLVLIGFYLSLMAGMEDHEIWNGAITGKDAGTEACCHCSKACPEGSSDECEPVCEHPEDYWWTVSLSTGDTVSIDKCQPDPTVPQEWKDAHEGLPAVARHPYTNYLLARPNLVLSKVSGKLPDVPDYPQIYDGYRIQRALNDGTRMDTAVWESALDELNTDWGSRLQVNVIVVATTQSRIYAQAIEHAWILGKKNDLIVVLGVGEDQHTIAWAEIVSVSKVPILRAQLEAKLKGHSLLQDAEGMTQIRDMVNNHFQRTPLEGYRHLAIYAQPPVGALILLYFFAIGGAVMGSRFMRKYEVWTTPKT